MYRTYALIHLRALAVVHTAPTCCGVPMTYSGAIGAMGWICSTDPSHVRTGG